MNLLYIVGEPGIGKTTLAAAITAGWEYEEAPTPFPHTVYTNGVWQLGRQREGGYPGTDAMAMDIQPTVLQFMEGIKPKLVMGEGARLGNATFLNRMRQIGYQLHIVNLVGPLLAMERRAARGSNQNENFIKGKRTQAINLSLRFKDETTTIRADMPPDLLVKMLKDPVSYAFRR